MQFGCVLYAENRAIFTAGNKVMINSRNKLVEWKAFVNTMGSMMPIWNMNFSSLTWAWIILKRRIVMLSYLSKNLEILVFCTILEKIPH